MTTINESPLPNVLYKGKVRDTHALDDQTLLMVATDRTSAFDVILPTGIPDKGAILCQLSSFWFDKTSDLIQNHFIALAKDYPGLDIPDAIGRQSMVVRKAERVDVECVVRGYITGSAWSEYKRFGTVGGNNMPKGLVEGDKFPEPLFTPTTKAEVGHDEPMTMDEVKDLVGDETTRQLAKTTIDVYNYAHDIALNCGIIIADTKMEFGHIDGKLSLIDELLTPDSSRFWDKSGYSPGHSQPNFDKQFVRDWLDSQGWNHEPPAPELPQDIVVKTRERYLEAFKRLTQHNLT